MISSSAISVFSMTRPLNRVAGASHGGGGYRITPPSLATLVKAAFLSLRGAKRRGNPFFYREERSPRFARDDTSDTFTTPSEKGRKHVAKILPTKGRITESQSSLLLLTFKRGGLQNFPLPTVFRPSGLKRRGEVAKTPVLTCDGLFLQWLQDLSGNKGVWLRRWKKTVK